MISKYKNYIYIFVHYNGKQTLLMSRLTTNNVIVMHAVACDIKVSDLYIYFFSNIIFYIQ